MFGRLHPNESLSVCMSVGGNVITQKRYEVDIWPVSKIMHMYEILNRIPKVCNRQPPYDADQPEVCRRYGPYRHICFIEVM